MRQAVRLIVAGHVQGLGFRAFVVRRATALGIAGWVRNRGDGNVEVLAEGDAESLAALAASCERGPPGATVTSVQSVPAAASGAAGFQQLPTAGADT